jgi:hypothetical protein
MPHFTIKTFVATTATALAPFLVVYNMPQRSQFSSNFSSLPKPRPLAAFRDTPKVGSEFNLI